MPSVKTPLTLQEFLNLPNRDLTYELLDGEAIAKVSPKRFHSKLTVALCTLLNQWCQDRGEIGIEWAVILSRGDRDWVPVPDLLYVSYDRLSRERLIDEACPVAPELVIEIISPDQTFGQMSEKATDYLNAGVAIVWVVDLRSKSVTIFYSDRAPQTKKGDGSLADSHLQDLQLTPQQIFHQAGLA